MECFGFFSVIRSRHSIEVLYSLQLPCKFCEELKLCKKTAVSYSSFICVFLGTSVQVQWLSEFALSSV